MKTSYTFKSGKFAVLIHDKIKIQKNLYKLEDFENSSNQWSLASNQHVEPNQLTKNKEKDRDLEHSAVNSNTAESVISNKSTNQQNHHPDMSMQHSYKRVSNLFVRSFPNMRDAGNSSLALRGGGGNKWYTQKMNTRHNNINHSYNLRNWVIPKNH